MNPVTELPMSGVDNQWRTPQYRQKVMEQIEDAMRQSGNPITKSSAEMEQHVFQKAHSREEYLNLVARLIIRVREIKNQNKGDAKSVFIGQTGPLQNPINALENLTHSGPGSNILQQPNMVPQGLRQSMPQIMSGPGHTGPIGGASSLPGPLVGAPNQPFQTYQRPQPPQMPGSHIATRLPQRLSGVRTDFMTQQHSGLQQQPFSQVISQPQSMSSGQFVPLMSATNINQTVSQPSYTSGSMSSGRPPHASTQSISQSVCTAGVGMTSVQSPVGIQGAAHSPATMLPSPSSMQQIMPSPASRPCNVSAPSPNNAMSTPSGPGSVGTASSPLAPSSQINTNEEQSYLSKWKQLQIYIEPLKRMINKMDKDEDRKNKMKNLLDILSDSSKRVSMSALLKCEQVLKQNFKEEPPNKGASSEVLGVVSTTETHLCQSLMDAIAGQIKSSMINHALHRTFGPAMQALHGSAILSPTPLINVDNSIDQTDIPRIIQGEVARLDGRFQIMYDRQFHSDSKTIHLLCYLSDKLLPSVPPIAITVPEDYPHTSPRCDLSAHEYESTPFLYRIQKLLSEQLLTLPDHFAVTAILDTWEMSIRQACNPSNS